MSGSAFMDIGICTHSSIFSSLMAPNGELILSAKEAKISWTLSRINCKFVAIILCCLLKVNGVVIII